MEKSDIQNLIKELVEKTTLKVNQVLLEDRNDLFKQNKGDTIWFSVEVDRPHFFWERGGEGLSALNHLVRRMVETKSKNPEEVNNILIDINGFQKKRIENIHAIAHMMAERARYFKSNIEIEPMSAFERRIVHEFLSEATDLKTESEGEGASRRVVIKYIGSL